MMVTFVSQCEKKALSRTRRVLDAFAERIGDNTWQTVITEDGLQTVKKMLRQTASKSTAVSCHWLRSRSRSQLLWIVGNRFKFNLNGVVPVNRTRLNLEHKEWEQGWYRNEAIVLAASIAGLFHDFGKANDLFQNKLKGLTDVKGEPYRHEWLSLALFEAFVKEKKDTQWLMQLTEIEQQGQGDMLQERLLNAFATEKRGQSELHQLAPFAKLVAWLIVSHHRLPLPHHGKAYLQEMEHWLEHCFDCHWNSANALPLPPPELIEQNWRFSQGTPLVSRSWQQKARKLASRALNYVQREPELEWFQQRFISHMARLSLMLADQYYSSLPPERSKQAWQDQRLKLAANTEKGSSFKSSKLKQKLDEHLIGVSSNALRFAQNLPTLKYTLPALAQHRLFSRHCDIPKFKWQNSAFKEAKSISERSEKQGFFGINMASTGCGKTLANARIMYGLANEHEGCRFSVALGLRTLTLQTGDSYRELLKLGDDDLAVLIGSQAVAALHQLQQTTLPASGSESADELFEPLHISYEGQIYDGRLKHWLAANPDTKLEKLLSAPVLVSTIDHLMPATESLRGGKQIAPMLRLLTSDLILDEPDDFGLSDLPGLCRLVNWAGMLGSRVLLSSATLPPSLSHTLFEAYLEGRKQFSQANFAETKALPVICAWFDEFKSSSKELADKDAFVVEHKQFVEKRVTHLASKHKPLRKGQLVAIEQTQHLQDKERAIYHSVAATIHKTIHQLHAAHHVTNQAGRSVSLGVVRMANIEPMVAVAKLLAQMPPDPDHSFHFCIYHSQFPLALRSIKESCLDRLLTRHDESALWQQAEIQQALSTNTSQHNVFIVIGTSVVEVGRDHDYDWAVAEPSSLRSLIQLAGRVQRHRQQEPQTANVMVLNQNLRALRIQAQQGKPPAYCKPGFETVALPLAQHELTHLITNELDEISAIPRIITPQFKAKELSWNRDSNKQQANAVCSFAVQEHRALRFALAPVGKPEQAGTVFYRSFKEASLWWQPNIARHASWHGEFIRQTKFRSSQPQEAFVLRLNDDEELTWSQRDVTQMTPCYTPQSSRFQPVDFMLAERCGWWLDANVETVYQNLSEQMQLSLQRVSEKFGEVRLRESQGEHPLIWCWHEQLGLCELKEG